MGRTPKWKRTRQGESDTVPSPSESIAGKVARGCGFSWGASQVSRAPVVETGAVRRVGRLRPGPCRTFGCRASPGREGSAPGSVVSKLKASDTRPIFLQNRGGHTTLEVRRKPGGGDDSLPAGELTKGHTESHEAEAEGQRRGPRTLCGDQTGGRAAGDAGLILIRLTLSQICPIERAQC